MRSSFSAVPTLYHENNRLGILILTCTIYILAPYKLSKDHSNMQTISLKVEDKYYKKYNRMLERWEIVVKYNNKEKEVEVSKDDFYEIKVGDKVLCDVYCQGKKIVAIELNEHWNET